MGMATTSIATENRTVTGNEMILHDELAAGDLAVARITYIPHQVVGNINMARGVG